MKRTIAATGALLLLAIACKTTNVEKLFFDEVGAMSKQAILDKGDALAAKKRYEDARKYYSYMSDSFPNDPLGRRAALKVADTFYAEKHLEALTEAQLRYKDFSNRYPNDPARAYALLMLGKCSYLQRRGPMRDLSPAKEAVESFRQVIRLFPDSPYAQEAREMLAKSVEDLARHELEIGLFYSRIGAWMGAKQRVDFLLATYPESAAAKEALTLQAEIQARLAPPPPAPTAPPGTPTPAGKTSS